MPCSWKMARVMYLDTFSSTSFTFYLLPFTGRQYSGQTCRVVLSSHPRMLLPLLSRTTKEACYRLFSTEMWLTSGTRHLCSQRKSLPVLTLYTKDPCPLCDDAMEELQPYKHKVSSGGHYNNNWHSVSLSQDSSYYKPSQVTKCGINAHQ